MEVSRDREGQRLDNFLARQLKDLPKSALYRLIRTGQVRVNGGRAKPDRKLVTGDVVRVPPVITSESSEFRVSKAVCDQVESAILAEDDDHMVVDKPSGMAVHGGSGLPWGLIDVVRQIRPGKFIELVHRIDRETSGCLVLACNGQALRSLSEQFRQGQVVKQYLCLLGGTMKQTTLTVDAPIATGQKGGEKHMRVDESGRQAVTHFSLLQQYREGAYATAEIETGRTHQIRVHAEHLGMPLAGDRKYGNARQTRMWRKRGLRRIFLHASKLELSGPSGETLTFSAPLPDALSRVLGALTLPSATGD